MTKVCSMLLTVVIGAIIFFNHRPVALSLLFVITFILLIIILFAKIKIEVIKGTATFSLVDLENAIKEVKIAFADKKSKRKSIDLVKLEKLFNKKSKEVDIMNKELFKLYEKEDERGFLSEEDKKTFADLENKISDYNKDIEKQEIKLNHYKKTILKENKEDKDFEISLQAAKDFIEINYQTVSQFQSLQTTS